jgi:hypothetical protein
MGLWGGMECWAFKPTKKPPNTNPARIAILLLLIVSIFIN